MTRLTSGGGEAIHLGAEIGRGGEGTVHSIQGKPSLAAKIYKPERAQERMTKIAAMTSAGWRKSDFVAFPVDTLFDPKGVFVGFTMPKVGGHNAVHQLYSPAGRKDAFPTATYPFLVRCVVNIARAMAGVHSTGCVIGDINHSGILVSDTGIVTLIDSDSFQVRHNGQLYPCKVGVQEFTPPELQGKSLDKVLRTENHDAFGLAVLLFYTLFMGRHPFAGRYLGSAEMPMDRAIAEHRFAYSARRTATQMEPPPNVPRLDDFPLKIADAFELAFGPAGSNSSRPTAKDWVALLAGVETDLVRCAASSGHHHFRQASSCPWCRMEKAYPGFLAFTPVMPTLSGAAPINLVQLIAAVRNVPDPGPPPALSSLVKAAPVIGPSEAVKELRSFRKRQISKSMLFGAAGVAGSAYESLVPVLPLAGFGISAAVMFSAFLGKGSSAAIDSKAVGAERAWRDKEASFAASAGNETFNRIKADAQSLTSQIQKLPAEEQKSLSDLASKVQQTQMTRFLEAHTLEKAKIKSIGTARKLTLRSYGIETAADVVRGRIERVYGFGPAKAQLLLAWRRSVEGKFRFDPKRGVDPRDIASVKSDIARRRIDGELRLKNTVSALRRVSTDALAVRNGPLVAEQETFAALEQARADQQALALGGEDRTELILLAAFLAFIGLVPHFVISKPPNLSAQGQGQIDIRPVTPVEKKPLVIQNPTEILNAEVPNVTPPQMEQNTAVPTVNRPIEETQQPQSASPLPPLPPPREIKTIPSGPPATSSPSLLDLSDKIQAARVQQQLKSLGFLAGDVDGVWGRQSQAALQAFRVSNRLGEDDLWDAETQERLLDFNW
jgi:DNA-binding helix-hairpin-helix protein with protein kinase domain